MTDSKEEKSKNTLFIKNIPKEVTKEQLESFCSDFGPLKSAVVVIDPTTKESKGFGFVQFATSEDATTALEKIPKTLFHGSKLKVDFALHRQRKEGKVKSIGKTESNQETKVGKKVNIESIKMLKKYQRSVLLWPVQDLPKKQIYKKVKKYGKIVDIEFPFQSNQNHVAKVLYTTPQEAQNAIKHLNEHIFKGKTIYAAIMPNPIWIKKEARVVLRNLNFHTTEQDLIDFFSEYGPLLEFMLPLRPLKNAEPVAEPTTETITTNDEVKEENEQTKEVEQVKEEKVKKEVNPLNKGFAFVTFISKEMAQKAIKEKNAQTLKNRQIAIDFVLPKDQFMQSGTNDEEKESEIEEINAEDNSEKPNEEDGKEDNEEAENENSEIDNQEEDEKSSEKLPELKEPDGKTLFCRNIPFTTTQKELYHKFSTFGKLKYIAMCKKDGIPKGSAFICFENEEDAQKCLDKSQIPSIHYSELGSLSILDPDVGIQIHGRPLFLFPALSKEQSHKEEEKKDKRNLYLLKESLVAGLSEEERQLRQDSIRKAKQKLQKHLHLYVSPVRVSLRGLGKSIDEKKLKEIIREQIKVWQNRPHPNLPKLEKEGLTKPVKFAQVKIQKSENKSLGFAFVEFVYAPHALACVQMMNLYERGGKKILCEFAIENSIIVKKRKDRIDNWKSKNTSTDQNDKKTDTKKRKADPEDNSKKSKKIKKEINEDKQEIKSVEHKKEKKKQKSKNKKKDKKKSNNEQKNEEQPIIAPVVTEKPTRLQKEKKKNPKKKRKAESDDFDGFVSKYKEKLLKTNFD